MLRLIKPSFINSTPVVILGSVDRIVWLRAFSRAPLEPTHIILFIRFLDDAAMPRLLQEYAK